MLCLELWKYTPSPWTSRFTSSSRIITSCSSVNLGISYSSSGHPTTYSIYIWASVHLRQLNNAHTSCDPWDIRIVLHVLVGWGLKVKFLYQNDTFLKVLMSCEAKLFRPAIFFATYFTKLGIPELLRKVLCLIELPFYINNRITNNQSKHNFSWVLEKSLFHLMSTLIYNRVLNSYTKLRSDNKIKNLIQLQSYKFLFKTVSNNL